MTKLIVLSVVAFVRATTALGFTAPADSLSSTELQEVVVSHVRASANAPFAVTNINSQQLQQFQHTAHELPYLFARTPGIIAWSENGVGIGTTYMRIRGSADSRINVTLDGMPLNSPEDQCVFWANTNSYAALLGSVQIQRGVGTSTNGDGAFSGSISLSTRAPELTPSGQFTVGGGSYGTWRIGARATTGLLFNHLVVDAAYNQTSTDGYVHGTSGRAGSTYAGATWLDDKFTLSYKYIGNYEHTGQAWNGVIAGDYDGDLPLDASYRQLVKRGMGRWNSLYEHIYVDADGTLTRERYRMRDGSLWPRTTDNFSQHHNLVSAVWHISPHTRANATLRYTYGHGYYQEFRYNNKLSKYGLPNFTLSDGSTLKRTDFVRQKGLTQHTYGATIGFEHRRAPLHLQTAVTYQRFDADHYGYLTYIANPELASAYLTPKTSHPQPPTFNTPSPCGEGWGGVTHTPYPYYLSDATKHDLSAYARLTLTVAQPLEVFADLQYRYCGYLSGGYNDKYLTLDDGQIAKHYLDINHHYHFLNPKAGIAYNRAPHRAYASLSLSHREPERNNFTDNGHYPAPRAEQLLDYELGYEHHRRTWHAAVNLYYMRYRNQFVQTGALSDIGEALTTNIRRSYRCGVELVAGVTPLDGLTLDGNLALSLNRLRHFDEIVDDWYAPDGTRTNHYRRSTLAYSPSSIANIFVTYQHASWQLMWHTTAVSRMYLDNSQSRERSLPSYHVSNITADYTFNLSQAFRPLRAATVGLHVSNLFNRHYAASGFVWYQYYDDTSRHSQLSYIPSAGRTIMATLTLHFK